MWSLAALVIGFCIDLLVGDPHGFPHPVVLIGKCISVLERVLRCVCPKTPAGERAAGAILWGAVVIISTAVPALLLWLCGLVSPWLRLALESVMCWQILAVKSLRDETMKVYDALESGDLAASRRAVSMIVGRDTDRLDDAAVTRAAVETAGGDIRVCEKQLASCEAEQAKAGETARLAKEAADRFFGQYPLLEPLARERFAALSKEKGAHAAAQSAEKAQARLDDALAVYLTGTLEPAQKEYNARYVCDYPLGLAGIEQYRAPHESLVRIDLERYAARLEQAQRDCKDRFRKDILFRMKDDIFNARRQFRELNKVMEQLTYGEEVYRFELGPSRDPQLAAFYQVIVDKGNQQMTDGDSLDNLAATADPIYERQVDELMEKIMADVDENTRARQEGRRPEGVALSDYVDYRTYLNYDIKVTNTVSGQQASLSRVSRDSSGGENQAPFYVAICASLLQIYEKSENSIRLVLLDEAFSKMTSDRIRPMMELFRRLQLQVLLISTVEKSTAIQPYCDITYSIVRHGDANAIAPFVRLSAE